MRIQSSDKQIPNKQKAAEHQPGVSAGCASRVRCACPQIPPTLLDQLSMLAGPGPRFMHSHFGFLSYLPLKLIQLLIN